MDPQSDIATLLQGCLDGDRRCQQALYDRYSARFYALCYRYTGDSDEARDALVTGFTRVFRCLKDYRGEGDLEAWMRIIFVRQSLNICLARQRRRVVPLSPHLAATLHEPHQPVRQYALREAIEVGLNQLNAKERAVFNLHAVDGYTFEETAQRMGYSLSNVKVLYKKACLLMRETLNQLGIDKDYGY